MVKPRAYAAFIVFVLIACALLSANERKPFLTPAIDPGPGVLPARDTVGGIICTPTTMQGPERAKIVRT